MDSSGDTIVFKESKERIVEEMIDQILHLIQVELLVRVETYTQLTNGTILAHGSNFKLGNDCQLHQEGYIVAKLNIHRTRPKPLD